MKTTFLGFPNSKRYACSWVWEAQQKIQRTHKHINVRMNTEERNIHPKGGIGNVYVDILKYLVKNRITLCRLLVSFFFS